MRAGAAWDLLGVVALLAPVAGARAPRTVGSAGWGAVAVGRWGALAAAVAWTGMVAAGAHPTIGAFDPEPLAMGAMAATALLAAALASGGPAGPGRDLRVVAPPAAAVVGLLLGLVDAPEGLGSPRAATFVVLTATAAAVAVVLVAGSRRPLAPLVLVLLPTVLLVALRAGRSVPDGPHEGLLAAAGPGVALLAAGATWSPPRWSAATAATGPLLVAAAALSPLGPARAGAGLLAAAVVLRAAVPARWTLATCAPGIAVLAVAAADVPAPGDPGLAHPLWAAAVAVVAIGLVVRADRADDEQARRCPALEVQIATAVLAAWILVGPGHWRWAGAPGDALAGWERAAAVGAAAVVGAAALGAALPLAPRAPRVPDREPEPRAG